jgi:hypothetical protein
MEGVSRTLDLGLNECGGILHLALLGSSLLITTAALGGETTRSGRRAKENGEGLLTEI